MRLAVTEHTSRPWRIHGLARGFRVEDVWALPVACCWEDFPRLVAQLAAADPLRGSSRASRVLWVARERAGALLGWDDPGAGLGSRVPALRGQLPADLLRAPGPEFAALPFTSLYLLGDEFAAEMANRTVHAVMHVGWVPDDSGGYRGQLAVLVRPNGVLGAGDMAAIRPLRNLIVYPRMMRDLGKRWQAGAAGPAARAHRVAVPPAARSLSTLPRIDYADAFFIAAGRAGGGRVSSGPARSWKERRSGSGPGCCADGACSGSGSAGPGRAGASWAGGSGAPPPISSCSRPAPGSGCRASCCSSGNGTGCCSPRSCSSAPRWPARSGGGPGPRTARSCRRCSRRPAAGKRRPDRRQAW